MTLRILPPNWALQHFERDLAVLEIERLTGVSPARRNGYLEASDLPKDKFQLLERRLAFSKGMLCRGKEVETLEYRLEFAAGGGSRKVTSYALHGLHPYKGKFYPQLARALMNVCEVPERGLVVDPFAGCGTSVLEAALLNIRGLGVDANPLAVLVAQTKLQLIGIPYDGLNAGLAPLRDLPEKLGAIPNEKYLASWFPPNNLRFIKRVLGGIEQLSSLESKNAAKVVLSSVLREASYQDPKQLRVGRRKDMNVPDVRVLFYGALDELLEELRTIQTVPGFQWKTIPRLRSRVLEGDARRLTDVVGSRVRADAVITSPPYASALPYIDTDRLSLRLFGLMTGSQRATESRLIGNREISTSERRILEDRLDEEVRRSTWMPDLLLRLFGPVLEISNDPNAGFRKQRTAALLYAYFSNMRQVLAEVKKVLKPGGLAAFVIGDNYIARPDGALLRIPTASILQELADQEGLEFFEEFSKRLTSFGAPETVHQRNAMADERIVLFKS